MQVFNRDTRKAAGVLLSVIGFCFYCQSAIDIGFLNATRNDFAHLYLAGYLAERTGDFFDARLMLSTHRHLQIPTGLNPFVYPPFFALILIPLSQFSYATAWFLFSLLSHAAYFAALAILVKLIRHEDEPPIFWWGILLALSACFYPLMKTYSAGQMNTFMLLVIAGSAYLLAVKRETAAGLLLGLGAAIKITPAFFLLYCCWSKRWRAAAAGAAAILASVIISLSVMGVEVHQGFLSTAKDMGYGSSTWAQYEQTYHVDPFNQAPSAMWSRLLTRTETAQFGVIEGIAHLPGLAKILSFLTAASIVMFLLLVSRRDKQAFSLTEYSLWSIGMLLLPSLLWDHYLVQTMLALAVGLRAAMDEKSPSVFWLGVAVAVLAIPFRHHLPIFRQGWMTLIMSLKLVGLILLAAWLVRLKKAEKASLTEQGDS
ncbi:MAG: glycosyltransferase family 87 protein [Candidatus Hinthialibacter sp.]